MTPDLLEPRISSRIAVQPDGCWTWLGGRQNRGYGMVSMGRKSRPVLAHRYVYRALVGEIPDGKVLDHVCHNEDKTCRGGDSCKHRSCVNPLHLRVTTVGGNNRASHTHRCVTGPAQTHCIKGHEYTPQNTMIRLRRGGEWVTRQCRECSRIKSLSRGKTIRATAEPDGESLALAKAMRDALVTQAEVAELLGLRQATVSNRLLGITRWRDGEMDAVWRLVNERRQEGPEATEDLVTPAQVAQICGIALTTAYRQLRALGAQPVVPGLISKRQALYDRAVLSQVMQQVAS